MHAASMATAAERTWMRLEQMAELTARLRGEPAAGAQGATAGAGARADLRDKKRGALRARQHKQGHGQVRRMEKYGIT